MKESLYSPIKAPIFKETFTSEDLVRKNGGTPAAVTFSNGVGSFNGTSSKIVSDKIFPNGAFTVRAKLKTSATPTGNRCFFSAGVLEFYTITTNNTFTYYDGVGSASGTTVVSASTNYDVLYVYNGSQVLIYVNGVLESTTARTSVGNTNIKIGAYLAGSNFWNGDIELIEVYNYSLTAQEVSNLYNNKRYVNPVLNHGQVTSTTDVNAGYDFNTWTAVSATIDTPTSFTTAANGGVFKSLLVVGKRYRLVIAGTTSAASFNLFNSNSAANAILTSFSTVDFTAVNASLYFRNTGAGTTNITTFSIKEITQDSINEILNVDAKNGVIENKYNNNISAEMIINGGFDTDTTWTKSTGWTISDGVAKKASGTASNLAQGGTAAGLLYRVIFTISGYVAGTVRVQLSGGGGGAGTARSANGTYSQDIIAGSTAAGTFYIAADSSFEGNIDNVSCKAIVPAIVNTATTISKEGGIYAMDFNGTTSKIDCGSYDTLVGDKTFIAWIKPRTYGAGNFGRLLNNDKFAIGIRGIGSMRLYESNDGATTIYSPVGSIVLGNTYLVVITRTFAGIVNFYINGVLSGTANQSGGAPVVGTTNITIGNTSAANYTLDGKLSGVRIVNGILSAAEISNLFSAERKFYNI